MIRLDFGSPRLTMQWLADGMLPGIILCTPTGGHLRVTRTACDLGVSFTLINLVHDLLGSVPQSLTSNPASTGLSLAPSSPFGPWSTLICSRRICSIDRRRLVPTLPPSPPFSQPTWPFMYATNQFHQRAVELADQNFVGSYGISSAHITTWAWVWFFLLKRWNLAWAFGDLSTFAHSFLPEF